MSLDDKLLQLLSECVGCAKALLNNEVSVLAIRVLVKNVSCRVHIVVVTWTGAVVLWS